MDDLLAPLTRLLSDVILPNLKAVQARQAEQIAANDSLENSIEELRVHLASQFALLAAQLTACRAEVAATQAMLRAFRQKDGVDEPVPTLQIH
jgi:hypothetical protein